MKIRLSLSLPALLALIFSLGAPHLAAQEASADVPDGPAGLAAPAAAPEDQPQRIELTLIAAPEPRPALKYRLVPAASERTPGNAVPYYYRSLLHLQTLPKEHWKQHTDNYDKWIKRDHENYPAEEVARWLEPTAAALSQLKVAVYREECEWDHRIQDLRGPSVVGFLLHEFQECRQLARVLQIKAHHELMTGRPDEAFETLRMGYQLAHDVGKSPLLISGLVGVAIGQIMNQELEFWMQSSPGNLYWALREMPQPLVDLRQSIRFELNLPNQIFPVLANAETAEHSPEEWQRLIVQALRDLMEIGGGSSNMADWQVDLAAAAMAAKLYPVAKAQLIAGGLDPGKVEAMPVGQVIAIFTARTTEYAYHEMFKATLLPYDQAIQRLDEIQRRLIQEHQLGPQGVWTGKTGLPIASLLLPALSSVLQAETRQARNHAVLQALEALRMHVAANGGKLPATLAEVTIVPVPDNPATGQPFSYKLDAATGTATLEVPSLASLPARHDAKRYVLRLAEQGTANGGQRQGGPRP